MLLEGLCAGEAHQAALYTLGCATERNGELHVNVNLNMVVSDTVKVYSKDYLVNVSIRGNVHKISLLNTTFYEAQESYCTSLANDGCQCYSVHMVDPHDIKCKSMVWLYTDPIHHQ